MLFGKIASEISKEFDSLDDMHTEDVISWDLK